MHSHPHALMMYCLRISINLTQTPEARLCALFHGSSIRKEGRVVISPVLLYCPYWLPSSEVSSQKSGRERQHLTMRSYAMPCHGCQEGVVISMAAALLLFHHRSDAWPRLPALSILFLPLFRQAPPLLTHPVLPPVFPTCGPRALHPLAHAAPPTSQAVPRGPFLFPLVCRRARLTEEAPVTPSDLLRPRVRARVRVIIRIRIRIRISVRVRVRVRFSARGSARQCSARGLVDGGSFGLSCGVDSGLPPLVRSF